MIIPKTDDKFVSGSLDTGRLILVRRSGSTARCGVVIATGGTVTDNGDGTFEVTFA